MRMGAPVDVLLVVGKSRAGLAVARSLARRGVSFAALSWDSTCLPFYSRHVKDRVLSPSPLAQAGEFSRFLVEIARNRGAKLVIPVTDATVVACDRIRDELEPQTKLALPEPEALGSVLDKRVNLDLARKLGVPCPRQFDLDGPEQIPAMIEELGFPIVLKPPAPPEDLGRPKFPFKVLYAHDEQQLRRYVDQYCRDGTYPLFQECAVGKVHNLCCFAARGEILAIHEYHSIRRLHGEGVLRMIVEPIPEAERSARTMLAALDWDGVAHVGFFVSSDHRKLWYMETNGRFWASVQGSVHAGWDFPYWTYDYFLHGNRPEPVPIRMGSRTCWHRGDLEALVNYLGGGEVPATGTNPGRIRAVFQYLSGFSPAIHSDVFSWNDPLPAIAEHWQRVVAAGRRLRRSS